MRPLLYGQGHGAPPCTVRPGLLPEVKLPPLLCFRGGRARADVRMGPGISAAVSASAAGDRRGVARARLRARRGGRAWGGEVRGAWDLPYSGLGPVPPQFWPRGTDPAGQLPRPFSRTPRRHGGSRGLACAPRGSASACRFRVSPRREGGDVASTLLGRGPPDAACGNASRSIRFLIEVRLGFKSN